MKSPFTKDHKAKQPPADPNMQGEGNITAARRNRSATEAFATSGKVAEAAKKAAPRDAQEAEAMRKAETIGLNKARK